MGLSKSKFWSWGSKTWVLPAATLAAILIGSGLFYVSGSELADHQTSSNAIASNAFPVSKFGVIAAAGSYIQSIYCASDDGRRNYCRIDTSNGVRLVRQRSDAACVQGRTWGFDRRGVWVDRGCRADFEAAYRDTGRDRDRDRDRDQNRDRDRNRDYNRGGNAQTFYCESGDMRRHWCSEGIGGRVRLVRQRSDAPCIQGRTWGRDRAGVWVDRGCRADFEVIR